MKVSKWSIEIIRYGSDNVFGSTYAPSLRVLRQGRKPDHWGISPGDDHLFAVKDLLNQFG